MKLKVKAKAVQEEVIDVTFDIKEQKPLNDFVSMNKSLRLSKRPSMWKVRVQ